MVPAMRPGNPLASRSIAWLGKGALRLLVLLAVGAAIAGIAAAFGIARDYGYLHASILTGSLGGQYHALGTRLADRARREHGQLTVTSTAGSIENVSRLSKAQSGCAEKFALIQDGTPVPADSGLELLGRLPKPESLLLLGRQGRAFRTFADLRGASIGIGPQGSGTAYLAQQLFEGPDFKELGVQLSHHELTEQAALVAQDKLDLAAIVIDEDAEFIRTTISRHGLDIVAPQDLDGLIARYPWLSVGVIPAGRYDLVRPIPPTDKQIARLGTLVVANACAKRADRIALLMLLAAELPGFVRGNPPGATSSATVLPLASEAHQFFRTGEPELADRYFPWLVNLMSPAYWVYLVMAVTVLFNAMNGYSRFRLWRLDAAREKLEAELKALV
ncbi:MAG TPA: TAXI family TRAP transporter solute-binding subunit, partial [Xanthobacteraceae bacterium]|nr:TAXI family TRAP transporter solute-binding subunit [Xanthobacteraceae bacterium]